MEIEENPRTFSLLVTEQEMRTLTLAVENWMETATEEDTDPQNLTAMYQQLRDALEEEAVEEEGLEEEAVGEEAAEEEE